MYRLLVWGTGKRCRSFIEKAHNCKVLSFVETCPRSTEFCKIQVVKPDMINTFKFDFLIITPRDTEEIENRLYQMGAETAKVIFLDLTKICNPGIFISNIENLKKLYTQEEYASFINHYLESFLYFPCEIGCLLEKRTNHLELLEYAKEKGYLQRINYDFVEADLQEKFELLDDANCNMHYFIINEQKIYVPKEWGYDRIVQYFTETKIKYNPCSPEYFENKTYMPVVVTDGINDITWIILNIDSIGKVYLLNIEEEWKSAILKSIELFPDKVILCDKLDDIVQIDFLILDRGIKNEDRLKVLLKDYLIKRIICYTYHTAIQKKKITSILAEKGYICSTSKGYIYYPYNIEQICDLDFRKAFVEGIKIAE